LALVTGAVLLFAGVALPALIAGVATITAISLPWLLIIGAIAAAILGVILIVKNWDKIMSFFMAKFEAFKKVLGKFRDFFIKLWTGDIKGAMTDVVNFLIEIMERMINRWLRGFRLIIKLINLIPGVEIPLPEVDLSRFKIGAEGSLAGGGGAPFGATVNRNNVTVNTNVSIDSQEIASRTISNNVAEGQ